jgi:hypothetical protein
MRFWVPAGLLAAVLALAGCATLPPPAPPGAALSASAVLERLRSRETQVHSFEAKGRLTFLSRERNYSGTGILLGYLPSTLRVDIRDFFGRTLLNFYSNGQEVRVLSLKEAKLYQGPATAGNLAAFIPPGVTLPQVVRLLMADLPLSPGPPNREQYEHAQGQYLMEWNYPDGQLKERLWVEGSHFNPLKDEWYDAAGRLRFSIEYRDFGLLAPHLPGQIILHTRQPEVELRLAYSKLQLNPPLKESDLMIKPAPEVAVVPLKP